MHQIQTKILFLVWISNSEERKKYFSQTNSTYLSSDYLLVRKSSLGFDLIRMSSIDFLRRNISLLKNFAKFPEKFLLIPKMLLSLIFVLLSMLLWVLMLVLRWTQLALRAREIFCFVFGESFFLNFCHDFIKLFLHVFCLSVIFLVWR